MNKKVFLLLFLGPPLGIAFLASIALAIFLFTPLPFNRIADDLRRDGYEVEGLSGSLNSGLTFARLAREDELGTFELRDVKIAYSGLWQLYGHSRLILENVEIGHMRLHVRRSSQSKAGTQTGTRRLPFQEIGLRRADIRDIHITHPDLPFSVHCTSLRVAKLRSRPREARVELGELAVESNLADFEVRDLLLNGRRLVMDKPLTGTIKTPVHTLIRKDIPFSAKISAEGTQVEDAVIALFGGQLKFEIEKTQRVSLYTSGLTLSDYFETSLPIEDLDLEIRAESLKLAVANSSLAARFNFRGVPFVVAGSPEDALVSLGRGLAAVKPGPVVPFALIGRRPLRAFHMRDEKTFELAFLPYEIARTFGGRPKPWARIKSDTSENPQQVLADLLYSQPYEQLSEVEQRTVAGSLKNFVAPDTTSPEEIRQRLQNLQIALATETDSVRRRALDAEARHLMMVALGQPPAEVSGDAPLACVNPSKGPLKSTFNALDGAGLLHELDGERRKLRSWVAHPSESLKRPGVWPTVDSVAKRVFLAMSDRVLDVSTGKTWEPPNGMPKLGASAGAAYDSLRKRLVVLGGRDSGRIYSVDTATGEWSLAANLPSGGFGGLAYDRTRDKFYSLRSSDGTETLNRLAIFAADLTLEREVPLKDPAVFFPTSQAWSVSAENGLLVVDKSASTKGRGPAVSGPRTLVIDTGCGELVPF